MAPADGGRYMCQVNTEPMMSQTHYLYVVGKLFSKTFISIINNNSYTSVKSDLAK